MFKKILIANRGEIACRVIRTARKLGIKTVAVYSEADAEALHVALADEAYLLGPAAARDSYLRGDKIIAIAQKARAQAIHPGYGFLSENEAFAQACEQAGLVFIGPPASAIRAMGSKSEAKTLMGRAGVPLVPGYHGTEQSSARLKREADAIGYPVLIKASAGGGGKGMRIVERAADFAAALQSCQREAKASFNDDKVLLEKYLERPRHIEIQVFADQQGNCVYLFERDCSVQRRHQKVLEEAPAPGMTAERRAEMGKAAVAAAKAVNYVGAGTVEFIAEQSGNFYFMEMNTRLQVEHPVTEMITGLDLVEWQCRVAAGEPLPLIQEQLSINGHALEARIYAEDPHKGFLPSIGKLIELRTPSTTASVRIDTGVREGDEISPYYDPMIAKLIVWGDDREQALARLAEALSHYRIVGLATNVEFLYRLVNHAAFAQAHLDTGLIERHRNELLPVTVHLPEEVLAVAVLGELQYEQQQTKKQNEPNSPWQRSDGWWLNCDNHRSFKFVYREQSFALTVHYRSKSLLLDLPDRQVVASVKGSPENLVISLGAHQFKASMAVDGEDRLIYFDGQTFRLHLQDLLAHAGEEELPEGHLTAPMPGTIVAVHVKAGDRVEKGAALLILEAMKMEHTITAPMTGVVENIFYAQGEQVQEGVELIALKAEANEFAK